MHRVGNSSAPANILRANRCVTVLTRNFKIGPGKQNPELFARGLAAQGREGSMRSDQAYRVNADVPQGAGIDVSAGEQAMVLV